VLVEAPPPLPLLVPLLPEVVPVLLVPLLPEVVPVPLVPLLPEVEPVLLVPLLPEVVPVPLVPLLPLLPEVVPVPLVPLLPELVPVPLVPLLPEVVPVPFVPLLPEVVPVPLVPLLPEVVSVLLVPLLPGTGFVSSGTDKHFDLMKPTRGCADSHSASRVSMASLQGPSLQGTSAQVFAMSSAKVMQVRFKLWLTTACVGTPWGISCSSKKALPLLDAAAGVEFAKATIARPTNAAQTAAALPRSTLRTVSNPVWWEPRSGKRCCVSSEL